MELMDIPLHHFYKKVQEIRGSFKEHEDVLSVIAFSVRCVLAFLLFTVLQVCSRGIAMRKMSVRPSVCQTREL